MCTFSPPHPYHFVHLLTICLCIFGALSSFLHLWCTTLGAHHLSFLHLWCITPCLDTLYTCCAFSMQTLRCTCIKDATPAVHFQCKPFFRTEKMSHMHRRTGEALKWCGGMGFFISPHHVIPQDLHRRCIWKLLHTVTLLLCTFGARITITMHLWCKGVCIKEV